MKFLPFAGTRGVANTLIGLFGSEAVFEFRRERIWHADDDSVQEDDARQILPVLVVGRRETVTEDPNCESRAELDLLVPAANLRHRIVPRATRVLFERRVWSVADARAHYDGGRVHTWELRLTEI